MKIPNSQNAFIPLSKLKDYLLSETHAVGKSKAKFFRAIGFKASNINLLEEKLVSIAHTENVTEINAAQYGTKYTIDGLLETPNNTFVKVRTIWIIEKKESSPRFVTAYPS